MNGSSGSGLTHPTSIGIRFGWMAQATIKKRDKSIWFNDTGLISKFSHAEPMIDWRVYNNQAFTGMLSMVSMTLYHNSENRTKDYSMNNGIGE
jgi:hypothetical protein